MNQNISLTVILIVLFLSGMSSCNLKLQMKPEEKLLWSRSVKVIDTVNNNKKSKNIKDESLYYLKPLPVRHFPGMYLRIMYTTKYGCKEPRSSTKYNTFRQKPVLDEFRADSLNRLGLKKVLHGFGYFASEVVMEIDSNNKLKNKVKYILYPTEQYKIIKTVYTCKNTAILDLITRNHSPILFKEGDPLVYLNGINERKRIQMLLKSKGYYYAEKINISFEFDTFTTDYQIYKKSKFFNKYRNELNIDTSMRSRVAIVEIQINDSLNSINFDKYYLKSLIVNVNDKNVKESNFPKTYSYPNLKIFLNSNQFNPTILSKIFSIDTTESFNESKITNMYDQLQQIDLFKISDYIIEIDTTQENALKSTWNLKVANRRKLYNAYNFYFSNLGAGVSGSLELEDRNAFKTANKFSISPFVSYDWIVPHDNFNFNFSKYDSLIRDYKFGVNTKLRFPKFLFLRESVKSLKQNRASSISLSFTQNYRTNYYQFLNLSASLSYSLKLSKKASVEFNPLFTEITYFQSKTDAFKRILSNNYYLQKTYADALIIGEGVRLNWSNQNEEKRFVKYGNIGFEEAGGLVALVAKTAQSLNIDSLYKSKYYNKYLKFDANLNGIYNFANNSKLANRVLVGFGVPLNTQTMPFVKQYVAGGKYDIRGFRAMNVGPGSTIHSDSITTFYTGDIKIVFNTEYRFPLFNYSIFDFEGASFIDLGNTWAFREDPTNPKSQFKLSNFGKDISISTGIGLRMNMMNLIMIRFDWAVKLKAPNELLDNNGWVDFSKNSSGQNTWQTIKTNSLPTIAIGYPF